MSSLVTMYLAALLALVEDYIPLLGVVDYLYRLHLSPALAGAVTGIYVKVERPQTKGTMVARGVAQGLDLTSAMRADKSVVVF